MVYSIACSDSIVAKYAVQSSVSESEVLDRLKGLWGRNRRHGLRVRHITGKLLNGLLGTPADRQIYGEGTIRKASEQLGISRVEIYRMRRFADQFPDWSSFDSVHPSASWTLVKRLLADSGKNVRIANRSCTPTSVEGVRRTLQKLAKRLHGERMRDAASQSKLLPELKELAEAIHDAFGIVLTIGEYDVDTTRSAKVGTRVVNSDGRRVPMLPVSASAELPVTFPAV